MLILDKYIDKSPAFRAGVMAYHSHMHCASFYTEKDRKADFEEGWYTAKIAANSEIQKTTIQQGTQTNV